MAEKIDDVDFDEIQARVHRAIKCLEENDLYLFENDACERAIAHRFAVCLEREFPTWHVDCEYDILPPDDQGNINDKYVYLMARRRKGRIIQLEKKEAISVYPDIIVHRRKSNENLLAIEIKKSRDHDEIGFDMFKLEAYRRDEHLKYRFALFIRFQKPQKEEGIVDSNLFIWV
ncbi:MAG: hypothetical protein M1485_02415 [Chloroflexi bacterium]|nr:hypothetical protein [Chloroflexota bacterium]